MRILKWYREQIQSPDSSLRQAAGMRWACRQWPDTLLHAQRTRALFLSLKPHLSSPASRRPTARRTAFECRSARHESILSVSEQLSRLSSSCTPLLRLHSCERGVLTKGHVTVGCLEPPPTYPPLLSKGCHGRNSTVRWPVLWSFPSP